MFKSETDVSFRLYLLYYWTKTRFFHRLLMMFFCFWVLWLAFIVHKWRLFDIWRSTTGTAAGFASKDKQAPSQSKNFLFFAYFFVVR